MKITLGHVSRCHPHPHLKGWKPSISNIIGTPCLCPYGSTYNDQIWHGKL